MIDVLTLDFKIREKILGLIISLVRNLALELHVLRFFDLLHEKICINVNEETKTFNLRNLFIKVLLEKTA